MRDSRRLNELCFDKVNNPRDSRDREEKGAKKNSDNCQGSTTLPQFRTCKNDTQAGPSQVVLSVCPPSCHVKRHQEQIADPSSHILEQNGIKCDSVLSRNYVQGPLTEPQILHSPRGAELEQEEVVSACEADFEAISPLNKSQTELSMLLLFWTGTRQLVYEIAMRLHQSQNSRCIQSPSVCCDGLPPSPNQNTR